MLLCPPFTSLTALARRGAQRDGRRPDHALRGQGRLHGRDRRRDARGDRRRCASSWVTPSGASTSPRTTPTWRGRCASRSTPVCCRSSASARPLPSARRAQTEDKVGGQVDAGLRLVAARRARRAWPSPTSPSGRSAPARRPRPRWPRRPSASSARVCAATFGAAADRSASSTAAASRRRTSTSSWPQPDIDGVLVGGASLDPDEFARIVRFQAAA